MRRGGDTARFYPAMCDSYTGRMRVPTWVVERWSPGTVSVAALEAVRAMRARAYVGLIPTPGEAELAERLAQAQRRWIDGQDIAPDARMHVLLRAGQPVAVADTATRRLHHDGGAMVVLTLGGVATDPAARGSGFGRAVVMDAFARLEELGLPGCVFQTGKARGMYEKFGARCIDNRFIDRTDPAAPEANPWQDRYVMVYPGSSATWPEGVIDLNGPAY